MTKKATPGLKQALLREEMHAFSPKTLFLHKVHNGNHTQTHILHVLMSSPLLWSLFEFSSVIIQTDSQEIVPSLISL